MCYHFIKFIKFKLKLITEQYLINTDHLLYSIRIPAAIHCQNPNCTNQGHEQEIATLSQNITDRLQ